MSIAGTTNNIRDSCLELNDLDSSTMACKESYCLIKLLGNQVDINEHVGMADVFHSIGNAYVKMLNYNSAFKFRRMW